jgi:three-Cys-motif partner protein
MTKKPKDNSVGPWAKEKLDALGQYLSFYTTVLKKQGHWLRGTFFVDAFAGPGLSKIRKKAKAAAGFFPEQEPEQEEYLKGSPRVAVGGELSTLA